MLKYKKISTLGRGFYGTVDLVQLKTTKQVNIHIKLIGCFIKLDVRDEKDLSNGCNLDLRDQ